MEKRKIYDKVKAHIDKRQHTIIIGARQVGKSTLMRQLCEELKDEGRKVCWLNLEQRDVLEALNKSPQNLMSYFPINNEKEKTIAFIDEIQYLDDPTNFLKLIYDEFSDKVKIVASGSSAFYMDEKFSDSLAGRKRIFKMYTCSFGEYLLLGGNKALYEEYERIVSYSEAKSTMLALFETELRRYFRFGGYPAVVAEQDIEEKCLILTELRDSFIKRDIKEAGVNNPDAFYKLFRLLASQSGCLLNLNELSKTLNIKNDTTQKYTDVMQRCFHIIVVRPFFRNLTKELTKMPKVYVLDSGMRRCLLGTLNSDVTFAEEGAEWENFVCRSLLESNDADDVKFWRTTAGNEVDFVLPHLSQPIAIEVKRSAGAFKESKYRIFADTYPEISLSFVEGFPLNERTLFQLYNNFKD